MKKQTFILIASLGLSLLSYQALAQKVLNEKSPKVPDAVMKTFQKKFPAAQNVSWGKESKTEYEAEFNIRGQKMSANILADGTWKETEWQLTEKKLPQGVSNTLRNQFRTYDFEKAEVSDTPEKGKVYEVLLEKDESKIEVILKENGQVIKKENIGKENEENEGKEEKEGKD